MNTSHIYSILLLLVATPQLLESSPDDEQGINSLISYTPEHGWINDATLLLCLPKICIMCYQHNNYSRKDEKISWGMAKSGDLANWTDLHVVLPYNPKTQEQKFTGSGGVDHHNTTGFAIEGATLVCVLFTNNYNEDTQLADGSVVVAGTQVQVFAIFYLPPAGRQFIEIKTVIASPPAKYADQSKDFRDPWVFWYENHKRWVTIVALSEIRVLAFYYSYNFQDWYFMSEFSSPNSPKYQWECPVLVQLSILDTPNKLWVLFISSNPKNATQSTGVNPNRSATGSSVFYYYGYFDGVRFVEIKTKNGLVLYVDDGGDCYALHVFTNVNRTLAICWVNNWQYATLRTDQYKGALGLVRQLSLALINGVYRIIQQPAAKLDNYLIRSSTFTAEQLENGIMARTERKQAHRMKTSFKKGNFKLELRSPDQRIPVLSIFNFHHNKTICTRKVSLNPKDNGTTVTHCAEYTAGDTTTLYLHIDRFQCFLLCDLGWPVFTEVTNKIPRETHYVMVEGSSIFVSGEHRVYSVK